jgi:hypothetical protein
MTYDKQHRKNPIGSNVIHAGHSDFNWKNPRSPEYLAGNFNDVNCWQLDPMPIRIYIKLHSEQTYRRHCHAKKCTAGHIAFKVQSNAELNTT